ncbi:MAG TPA: hypothetical protein VHL10_01070 [Nitrososphaera sp.]|jgi:hypothetical protein|nr:hypothetical protein [Nitrososphaera sp.]
MGLSSKTQKTSSTTTPTNPAWVSSSLQGYNSGVDALAKTDPSKYVTGPSSLQQQAFTGASNLGGNYTGLLSSAKGLLDANSSAYGNPYTQQVIDSSLNTYDQQAGMTKAANAAAAAKNNAFGGSRYGIQAAQTDANLANGRSALQSGLLSDAYDKMVANNLATAGAYSGLAGQTNALDTNTLNTQAALGGQQRDIAQEQATAPLTFQQVLGQLYGQGQYGLFQGSNTTGKSTSTGSALDQIGQGLDIFKSVGSLFHPGAPK